MSERSFVGSDISAPDRAWWHGIEQVRRISRSVPLFYRVLVANVAVIVLGAVAGTLISTAIGRRAPDQALLPLIMIFVSIGIGLSLLVNVAVLRAAFRPMASLQRTAAAVQAGDRSARAPIERGSDPEMTQLAVALNSTLDELADDRNQLRDLASQVIRAQEDERRRVSRELHDDTAQILFAQLLRVTALKTDEDPRIQAIAERLEHSTADALEGVRRLALELRPPALDDLGLAEALAELCQRFRDQSDLNVDLRVSGVRARFSPDVEMVLYRVAQEALTNITKHARASHVDIHLQKTAAGVYLTIRDDGIGFDQGRFFEGDKVGLGLGLFGMRERASLVGGTFEITSRHGQGSTVRATIPMRTDQES